MTGLDKVYFALESDIPLWLTLVKTVEANFPGLEMESYTQTLKRNIHRETALCVKQDDIIVGILLFSPTQGCLSCMAVHPEYRRRGIASALIRKMLAFMPGSSPISVTTFRENDPLGIAPRALYRSLGFREAELVTEFGYPVQRFVLQRDSDSLLKE